MAPTLQIQLLGDFVLLSVETPITTVTVPRLQSLLAYLVLHSSSPQNRAHLSFLLWPDSDEAQAHTNLRQLLFHLRQSLPDAGRYLYADKQSLRWRPSDADAPWSLDVFDLERALVRARQAEQGEEVGTARGELERATRLYRGDLLPGCYDEWILPERDRLRQLFLRGAERLIALLERERELGTEPTVVTRAAYESLLHTDAASETSVGPAAPRRAVAPLLGRQSEWRLLQTAWRNAVEGHARGVIVTGEAGIGKTRLAEELEAWVSRQGMTTASARCYAAGGAWPTRRHQLASR